MTIRAARLLCAATLVLCALHHPSSAQKNGENPVGTWRGESKCQVRPSGCNDEDALYRVSPGSSADRVNMSAGKIVDGREVNMGSGECKFDARAGTLDCPLPNGNVVHLEVKGNLMRGKYTLRDGTLWRIITLRKDEQK